MINADNGPENSGVRTQWLKRLMEFSAHYGVTVQLACYPPYHSKYNPVERVFGVLDPKRAGSRTGCARWKLTGGACARVLDNNASAARIILHL